MQKLRPESSLRQRMADSDITVDRLPKQTGDSKSLKDGESPIQRQSDLP